jgi:DNA mismatch endonuclease (patch repair protein)
MDIVDAKTRSRMMSGIKGKNTRPEIIIRKELHRRGIRYRLHSQKLPGKPDIVFLKKHVVIFVHGCFWHGHNCHLFKLPSTRTDFWQKKIENNKLNDQKVERLLISEGWRILIIWECALKGKKKLEVNIVGDTISSFLEADKIILEIRGRE